MFNFNITTLFLMIVILYQKMLYLALTERNLTVLFYYWLMPYSLSSLCKYGILCFIPLPNTKVTEKWCQEKEQLSLICMGRSFWAFSDQKITSLTTSRSRFVVCCGLQYNTMHDYCIFLWSISLYILKTSYLPLAN